MEKSIPMRTMKSSACDKCETERKFESLTGFEPMTSQITIKTPKRLLVSKVYLLGSSCVHTVSTTLALNGDVSPVSFLLFMRLLKLLFLKT